MRTDTVDIKRFGTYFASDMRSNIANYGISAAILAGMGLIAYLFCGIFTVTITGEWVSYPIAGRAITLGVMMLIMAFTMPVKCYGRITDRKAGTQFVELPVSTFEKVSSMILCNAVIIPAVVILAYLGLDGLICLCDKGCGMALVSVPFADFMKEIAADFSEIPEEIQGIKAIFNPLLYIDDIAQGILIFLLGAVCFKKNKAAMTFLTLIGLSMAMSMISTPVMIHIAQSGNWDFESAEAAMEKFGWIINNVGLIDTISDTITNLCLSAAIYFRVKTLKF